MTLPPCVIVQPLGVPGPGDVGFGRDGLIVRLNPTPEGAYTVVLNYADEGGTYRTTAWSFDNENPGLAQYHRGTEPRGSMQVLSVEVRR